MRAFIAVSCPPDLRKGLAGVREEVKGSGDMKFVEPDNIHLTVKFLGVIDEGRVDKIVCALDKVKVTPFDASLKGLGVFPGRGSPKVLWAGIDSGCLSFEELHRKVDDALLSLGFQRDDRFTCHYTLARIKHIQDRDAFNLVLDKYAAKGFGSFKVSEMSLMESFLQRDGPVYSEVRRFVF